MSLEKQHPPSDVTPKAPDPHSEGGQRANGVQNAISWAERVSRPRGPSAKSGLYKQDFLKHELDRAKARLATKQVIVSKKDESTSKMKSPLPIIDPSENESYCSLVANWDNIQTSRDEAESESTSFKVASSFELSVEEIQDALDVFHQEMKTTFAGDLLCVEGNTPVDLFEFEVVNPTKIKMLCKPGPMRYLAYRTLKCVHEYPLPDLDERSDSIAAFFQLSTHFATVFNATQQAAIQKCEKEVIEDFILELQRSHSAGDGKSFSVEPLFLSAYQDVAVIRIIQPHHVVKDELPLALYELEHGDFPSKVVQVTDPINEGESCGNVDYTSTFVLLSLNDTRMPGKRMLNPFLASTRIDFVNRVTFCVFCKSRHHTRSKCPTAPNCRHCGRRGHPSWRCHATETRKAHYREERDRKRIRLLQRPSMTPLTVADYLPHKPPAQSDAATPSSSGAISESEATNASPAQSVDSSVIVDDVTSEPLSTEMTQPVAAPQAAQTASPSEEASSSSHSLDASMTEARSLEAIANEDKDLALAVRAKMSPRKSSKDPKAIGTPKAHFKKN